MKESLLHFIWKTSLFSKSKLKTTSGAGIYIKSLGFQNFDSGPDFLNAQIEIEDQLWVGNVEMHIKSSNWYEHGHHTDMRYESVILHVVWEHDMAVFNKVNTVIPTLVLKNYVAESIIANYQHIYLKKSNRLPCEKNLQKVDSLKFNHWLGRLFIERLEQKIIQLKLSYQETNHDWEAVLFRSLTENFGLKTNRVAFKMLAEIVPINVVRKLSKDVELLESLFMGCAGLLENSKTDYKSKLYSNFLFLKQKFNLDQLPTGMVQFFRLRPLNFPTVRLAQLAALYHKNCALFTSSIGSKSLQDLHGLLQCNTTAFWDNHYTFETESKKRRKPLASAFIDLLIINVIIPIKYFHARVHGSDCTSEIIALMEELKPEKNRITEMFNGLGVKATNAFNTQSLIQLNNAYCSKKRCLECVIGKELISA